MKFPIFITAVGLYYYPEGGVGDIAGVYQDWTQATEAAKEKAHKMAKDEREPVWWEVSVMYDDGSIETLEYGRG